MQASLENRRKVIVEFPRSDLKRKGMVDENETLGLGAKNK